MDTIVVTVAGLSGACAVALGAIGSHRLRDRRSPEEMEVFATAVRYHVYHTLAGLFTAVLEVMWPYSRAPRIAAVLFLIGIVLFSGGLYLRVWTRHRGWGRAAPLGGLAFILGWLALALTPW